jgi:iron complex transport system ATP-binding protein
VVHDLSLARAYGTRALLLHGGRLIASGKTEEVLSRENLAASYSMDVYAWMRDMLSQWE